MPKESSKHSSLAAVLLIAVLMPALYVLSIGPAAWLNENEYMSDETWALVYRPIVPMVFGYEPVYAVYIWYIELFIGHHPLVI